MRLVLRSYWRSSSAWRVRIGLGPQGLPPGVAPVNLPGGGQVGIREGDLTAAVGSLHVSVRRVRALVVFEIELSVPCR